MSIFERPLAHPGTACRIRKISLFERACQEVKLAFGEFVAGVSLFAFIILLPIACRILAAMI